MAASGRRADAVRKRRRESGEFMGKVGVAFPVFADSRAWRKGSVRAAAKTGGERDGGEKRSEGDDRHAKRVMFGNVEQAVAEAEPRTTAGAVDREGLVEEAKRSERLRVIREDGVIPVAADGDEDDVVDHLVDDGVVIECEATERGTGRRGEAEVDDEIGNRFFRGDGERGDGGEPRPTVGRARVEVRQKICGQGGAVMLDAGANLGGGERRGV